MNPTHEFSVKRILVAVDASPRSLAPLEMAVNLAARMQAQLETLFVEDRNLLNLAGLPFAKELDRTSGEARTLNTPTLSFALQTQTRRLRELMQAFGEQKQVQTNLRVVRGNYVTEAIRAKADVSFLFTSKRVSLSAPFRSHKPGLVRAPLLNIAPVYVTYTGRAQSERALLLASNLAETLGTDLLVLLPTSDNNATEALKKESADILSNGHRVLYDTIDSDLKASLEKIAAGECGLLVMPKSDATPDDCDIQTLEAIHCPVVLVA